MSGGDRKRGVDADEEIAELLRYSSDVIALLDDEGAIVRVSPAVERVLGYDGAELVGADALDYVHPEDRATVADRLRSLLAGELERTDREEFRFEHADGTWVWLEGVGTRRPDEDGGGVVIDARDATDRVRTRQERDLLFDRMTDAYLALDGEWRLTYLNDRAKSILDLGDEAIGSPLQELVPGVEDSDAYRRLREAMRTQEATAYETYYEPMETWFAVSAYPSETGLSVFFRDVTDRKAAERELERDERALRTLNDVAADKDLAFEEKLAKLLELGCQRLDLSIGFLTRIEEGKQTVVEARGDHELLQRGSTCPLSKAYCKRTIDADGLLATRDPTTDWVDEVAHETFGLETYLGGKVLVEGDLYGTLCFADTERRERPFQAAERAFIELLVEWVAYELERERRERNLQRKNDRLEAFASMVSHDLRNPLTVARGHLDLVEGDEEALVAIDESLDRMERLIDDMLWLAREGQDIGSVEAVDLAAVAEDAWRYVAAPDASLTIDGEETAVEADRDRLLQLLENLFRNALDHVGPDVAIRVGPLPEGGFYVEDDGPGVPEEEREAVFEAGYSTEDGTGIGLAIVEQIASAHGWTTTITAADDGGARFEFAP